MVTKPAVLDTLTIVPRPRAFIVRPAAAPSISTARIMTSMACSCGVVSALVSAYGHRSRRC